MQLLENWNPLNLPRGSIRALITLTLLAVLWTLMLLGREPSLVLCYLILMALSYYFGTRTSSTPDEPKRGPLFLPTGTIRVLIVLGFVVVGYFLWEGGRLKLDLTNRATVMLFMCAALLAGLIVGKLADLLSKGSASPFRRGFENIKSLVTLGLTAFLAFVWLSKTEGDNFALLAAPFIVFYFASRR